MVDFKKGVRGKYAKMAKDRYSVTVYYENAAFAYKGFWKNLTPKAAAGFLNAAPKVASAWAPMTKDALFMYDAYTGRGLCHCSRYLCHGSFHWVVYHTGTAGKASTAAAARKACERQVKKMGYLLEEPTK